MGKVRCSYFGMQAVVQILRTYNPTQFQYCVYSQFQYWMCSRIILHSFSTACIHIHFLTFVSCSAGFMILNTLIIMGKVRCSYFCMQAVVQILRTYYPTQFQYRVCSHSFLNLCKLQCRFYDSKYMKYHGESEVFIFLYVGCSTDSTYV